MSSTNASYSILGFEYQLLYGLLSLMKGNPNDGVIIEHFDDITVVESESYFHIQLKSSKTPKNIADNSVEFWKTIGNWAEKIKSKEIKIVNSNFVLFTMNNVKDGTIPYFLKPEINKILSALNRIHEIGPDHGNREIKNIHYPKFSSLTEFEQLEFLKKVKILDNSPSLDDIKESIKNEIFSDTDKKFVDEYFSDLYGWWRTKLQDVLQSETIIPITWNDLHLVRTNLRDRYRNDTFLTTISKEDVKNKIPISHDQNYIKQLILINKNEKTILNAKYDFAISKQQEEKWIEDNPGSDREISGFHDEVEENYLQKFDSSKDSVISSSNPELIKWVCKMYDCAMFQTNWAIRKNTKESYKRGVLHQLSEDVKIGWHPNHESELS